MEKVKVTVELNEKEVATFIRACYCEVRSKKAMRVAMHKAAVRKLLAEQLRSCFEILNEEDVDDMDEVVASAFGKAAVKSSLEMEDEYFDDYDMGQLSRNYDGK